MHKICYNRNTHLLNTELTEVTVLIPCKRDFNFKCLMKNNNDG